MAKFSKALFSLMSLRLEASTMLRTVYLLTALSLGTRRLQLVQWTGLMRPQFFLARPPFLRFFGIFNGYGFAQKMKDIVSLNESDSVYIQVVKVITLNNVQDIVCRSCSQFEIYQIKV